MFVLPVCGACLPRALHGHTVQHQPAITMEPALAVFAFPSPSPQPRVAKYLCMLLNKTCLPASLFSRLLSLERKTQKEEKSCLPRASASPGRDLREFSPVGIPSFFPRLSAADGKGWMLPADAEGAGGERGELWRAGRGRREEEEEEGEGSALLFVSAELCARPWAAPASGC